MNIAIFAWVIFILWAVFTTYWHWPTDGKYGAMGGGFLLVVLIFLILWNDFGFIVHK